MPTSSASSSKYLPLALKSYLGLADAPTRINSVLFCLQASLDAVPSARNNLYLLASSQLTPVKPAKRE